jgi:hypothetical protein
LAWEILTEAFLAKDPPRKLLSPRGERHKFIFASDFINNTVALFKTKEENID